MNSLTPSPESHSSPRGRRAVWIAGCAGALLLSGALVWIFARYELIPKRLVAVEPGQLFRSGQISPRLIRDVLEDHQIAVVLDLTFGDEPTAQTAERESARELGIRYVNIPLDGDGRGSTKDYARAVAVLARSMKRERAILVHCNAGARRSAAVITLYQVLIEGRTPEEAYAELDRYGSRPVAESPMLPFLNEKMGEISDHLVEMNVLEATPGPLPKFGPG
jgi:predicted protein tyrosine phosphatase